MYSLGISLVVIVCIIAMCIIFAVPRLPIRPCDKRPPAMYGHFCLVPRVSVHDRTYYCISLSALTIPPEVLVTLSRPDLFIHYPEANVIKIIELTVPFETNIEKDDTFKTNKYATLIQDIEDKQISSELTCVEVGCRG